MYSEIENPITIMYNYILHIQKMKKQHRPCLFSIL